MAAMEACLAARRVIAASPEPPKTAAELMAEQMKAAVAAPPAVSSTGPAAGNGKEILLQVSLALVRSCVLLLHASTSVCNWLAPEQGQPAA